MRAARSARIVAVAAASIACLVRLSNAFRYPADWGYDAPFNWRYIYRMSHDWMLPHPAAGWSTSDPPLFFTVSAVLMAASGFDLVLVPLLNTLAGLAIVALAVMLVRGECPDDPGRALIAGGLLLYLPAHIYMSVMVNEEMLAALFTSVAVFLLARRGRAASAGAALRRAGGAGLAAGLAVLTKLTGALAVAVGVGTYGLDGLRRAERRAMGTRMAIFAAVAVLIGGWFYARNQLIFGAPQPFGLPSHEVMFDMPPGERSLSDYVSLPLATWTDPQLLAPDLLHSVWGSTYATVWFDGHRYFLPRDSAAVTRLGSVTLVLALLPTVAFAVGLAGGIRRSITTPLSADTPMLLLVATTLAGFAIYTWQNPWFAVIKGTSLLGLSLPFAYYASEALHRWIRRGGAVAILVWLTLAGLAVSVVFSCTFDLAYEKTEVSGLDWRAPEGP